MQRERVRGKTKRAKEKERVMVSDPPLMILPSPKARDVSIAETLTIGLVNVPRRKPKRG